jgi:hypothetical protein
LGKIWMSKVLGPTWEFRGKLTFGCSPHGKAHSIR